LRRAKSLGVVEVLGRKKADNRGPTGSRRPTLGTSPGPKTPLSRVLSGSAKTTEQSTCLPPRKARSPHAQTPVKSKAKTKKRLPKAVALVLLLTVAFGLAVKFDLINLNTVKAEVLSHVTIIYPDKDGAYAFLGSHYTARGKSEQAIKACRTLVQRKPEDPAAHVLLGNAHHQANNLDQAMESYKEALQLDPESFDAHLGLGVTYTGLRRHAEAIELLEKAIRLKPQSAYAHLSLGLALSDSGQYDEAMEEFRKAKEIDPDIAGAHVLSGKVYLEMGLPEQAIERFKEAILFDRGYAQAYYSLGQASLQIGDTDLAIQQQRALQPLNPELAQNLAELIIKR
jgi:tetratricopeptide (TPR) repeat protein